MMNLRVFYGTLLNILSCYSIGREEYSLWIMNYVIGICFVFVGVGVGAGV